MKAEKDFNFSKKIIFCDKNKIKAYDLKTKETSVVLEVQNEIVSLDVINSSIFYIEENSTVIKSFSQSFGEMKFSERIQPKAIGIDALTKKAYILDESAGTIIVIDMIHNHYGIVLSDFEDLHDIVLDIEEGVMFIVQHLKSVRKDNFSLQILNYVLFTINNKNNLKIFR